MKLFNLNFEEINSIYKYHNDVLTYKVTGNNSELVSIFYVDFFPRQTIILYKRFRSQEPEALLKRAGLIK